MLCVTSRLRMVYLREDRRYSKLHQLPAINLDSVVNRVEVILRTSRVEMHLFVLKAKRELIDDDSVRAITRAATTTGTRKNYKVRIEENGREIGEDFWRNLSSSIHFILRAVFIEPFPRRSTLEK